MHGAGEGAAFLALLACEDVALLVWRGALLVMALGLDTVDGCGSLHGDLHVTPEAHAVGKGVAILARLACEGGVLLVWRDALLVLAIGAGRCAAILKLPACGDEAWRSLEPKRVHHHIDEEDDLLVVVVGEGAANLERLAGEGEGLLDAVVEGVGPPGGRGGQGETMRLPPCPPAPTPPGTPGQSLPRTGGCEEAGVAGSPPSRSKALGSHVAGSPLSRSKAMGLSA